MASTKKINYSIHIIIALIMLSIMGACTDFSSTFPVDNTHKRMFSPVTFTTDSITATSVNLDYTRNPLTAKYVMDISKQDSMKFDSIVIHKEIIPADSVSYPTGATIIFYTKFNNLIPATRYSARIKLVAKDPATADSKYDYVVFDTKAQ